MKILITGGTGFVGKKLGTKLSEKNHKLYVLTREKREDWLPYPCTLINWQELQSDVLSGKLEIDCVVNLAGESIAQKWTQDVKTKILDSRVHTTSRLVDIFKNTKLKKFISASAIGYYGDRGEELLSEDSGSGDGFLTDVCKKWEAEAFKIQDVSKATPVILRFGMVLGDGDGGGLAKMKSIFQKGIGGIIGDGQMWMSWIHIEDLTEMISQSIDNNFKGIYNAVSPNPVKNKLFSETLAKKLGKKLFLPVPHFAIKMLYGEMSQVVLFSQRVYPKHALTQEFKYKYETIDSALESLVQ